MKIFIPTYGRSDDQVTHSVIPDTWLKDTFLVVQEREKNQYADFENVIVLPNNVKTIAPTRQWILNNCNDPYIIMIDDDVTFYKRRKDRPDLMLGVEENDIRHLIRTIFLKLKEYPLVGVAPREGGNRFVNGPVECTRMMRVLGVRTDIFKHNKIKFDRLEVQEDFDVILQLLRKGYKNLLLTDFCQGQKTSNAAGGCSEFRTIELHNKNVLRLAELHSPYVKVVEKETKTAWGGAKRLDVRVQWRKAYADAIAT